VTTTTHRPSDARPAAEMRAELRELVGPPHAEVVTGDRVTATWGTSGDLAHALPVLVAWLREAVATGRARREARLRPPQA